MRKFKLHLGRTITKTFSVFAPLKFKLLIDQFDLITRFSVKVSVKVKVAQG